MTLAVRDGHGNLAGGKLRTEFRLQPQVDGRNVFDASCKLENVALGQLTRGSDDQPPLAEGKILRGPELPRLHRRSIEPHGRRPPLARRREAA